MSGTDLPAMSATEMAVAEANAVALGVPIDQLMETAGKAVAEEAQKLLGPPSGKVIVVAGPGNNGGDGTAAAHYLKQWGYDIEVRLLFPPSEIRSAPARRCYERIAERLPVAVGVPPVEELKRAVMLLDALLGSGQLGPLRGPYRDAVRAMQASGVPVLSVDIPTGLHDPEGIRPRWTVALTAVKAGMLPANSGKIRVREIGIPRAAIRGTGPGDVLYYPNPRGPGTTGTLRKDRDHRGWAILRRSGPRGLGGAARRCRTRDHLRSSARVRPRPSVLPEPRGPLFRRGAVPTPGRPAA